jgi:Peptidase M66
MTKAGHRQPGICRSRRTASAGRAARLTILAALAAACTRSDRHGVTEPPQGFQTAALAVSVTGLPDGAGADIEITGPGGYASSVAHDQTLTGLTPGTYSFQIRVVHAGGFSYAANPSSLTVPVSAGSTPVSVPIAYSLITGALTVTISGLPDGISSVVAVSGPGGYHATLSLSTTLSDLEPGAYTLSGTPVAAGSDTYDVPAPVGASVVASLTPTAATVGYQITTGRLDVSVTGLPGGTAASVQVAGPSAFSVQVTATTTLSGLTPGAYAVSAAVVAAGQDSYSPSPPTQSADVLASVTPTSVSVAYAITSGRLSVSVDGLPGGTSGDVTVTGPGGFHASVGSSTTLTALVPGTYTVAAASVPFGANIYTPSLTSQAVAVTASVTPANAAVTYALQTGTLHVTVGGLPGGASASVAISGPGGFLTSLSGTQTLSNLTPGDYVITANNVSNGGTTYEASPTSQSATVTSNTTASASVTYTPGAAAINLTIDDLYVTQVVQTLTGSVPLVAGRDGLLRVFVRATQANTAHPDVRVRFYSSGSLASTVTITAPGTSVPTSIDEGSLLSTWNVVVPAALLQPGLSLVADVDPGNAVGESNESDNAYPASGTPLTLVVQAVSPFNFRMVPINQMANSTTGNVTAGNIDQFLTTLKQIYPLLAVDADLRTPYTTSAPALQSNDLNGSWLQILSEVDALRTADGSSRYYFGVVHTTYTSGVAGLGYVPGRAAIGWDFLPSATGITAHEVGHNFGRWHAPCGNPSAVDASYPYAGGVTGVYGYDVTTGVLKPPTRPDLMGYCSNPWISDYTYVGVLNYRTAHPDVLAANLGNVRQPALLLWGRVHNGQVILEPAYEIEAPPRLPSQPGRNLLEGFATSGERLFSLSFDGEQIADAVDPNEQTFAFAVPLATLRGGSLTRLRLTALGQQVELQSAGAPGDPVIASAAGAPTATRSGTSALRVRWSEPTVRGVLIRDARTGQILSFAHGGDVTLRSSSAALEIVASDGVRSERRLIVPR